MSRITFKTGKSHQERAAIWARKRLADAGGRNFTVPEDQDGVLLADAVGLGKTWEAVAATALILYKRYQPQRNRRHVLILCPSNLVSKWEDELVDGSALRLKLDAWLTQIERSGDVACARRIHETLTTVLPIRRSTDVQTRKQRGRFNPPGGTYVISQTLISKPGQGLAALRRTDWDVVIVDEAHSAHARTAVRTIEGNRRAKTKILLSATPFQLNPGQWNGLATNIVKSGQKVMRHRSVARYVEALSGIFESRSDADPPPSLVKEASDVLGLIAARTVPRRSIRSYGVILLDGEVHTLARRLDAFDNVSVQALLTKLRARNGLARDLAFEKAYFENRTQLALHPDRAFIANRLRHALSQGTGNQESPRLHALGAWAANVFAKDLRALLVSGVPEKTILFTSLVGKDGGRDAERIRTLLADAYAHALASQRGTRPWARDAATGAMHLRNTAEKEGPAIAAALVALARDELTCVLAAKSSVRRRILASLGKRQRGIGPLEEKLAEIDDKRSFQARTLKRRLKSLRRSVAPWADGPGLRAVERYTGQEDRRERDRAATAFREIGPPWVLVASNVGSEGIDLHTYTRRIVHYDLEWNPARMEQREGRGDRLGRQLNGCLEILYCLVPDTYDERMFHQLVARDRWHGVLLGKPALKLTEETTDAPILSLERLAKLRLNLTPGGRG